MHTENNNMSPENEKVLFCHLFFGNTRFFDFDAEKISDFLKLKGNF